MMAAVNLAIEVARHATGDRFLEECTPAGRNTKKGGVCRPCDHPDAQAAKRFSIIALVAVISVGR